LKSCCNGERQVPRRELPGRLFGSLLAAALLTAGGDGHAMRYPAVGQDVAFSDVLALPAAEPQRRIAYGDAPSQFIDLWLPSPAAAAPAPVAVLIHGGCWLADYDIGHVYPLATALAAAGYAVWAPEYRRVGETGGGWPGTFADIAAAIDALQQLAPPQLDLDRVVLVGHSAGGQLALWALLRNGYAPGDLFYTSEPPALRGAIGLAAITDLAAYAHGVGRCQEAVPRLMGGMPAEQPLRYALASPAAAGPVAPVILLQGTADRIVPATQAAAMGGARVRLLDGAGHFDLIHPGSAAFAQLLAALQAVLQP
jgi:acetyl esterase/lipase